MIFIHSGNTYHSVTRGKGLAQNWIHSGEEEGHVFSDATSLLKR